jgi:glyceraldehyde 3-phosphate dehydrogenase
VSKSTTVFQDFSEQQTLADASMPLIGGLYRDRGVITLLYGRPIMHRTPMTLLEEHEYVQQVEDNDFSIRDTHPLLEGMSHMALTPARIDVGQLAMNWRDAGRPDVDAFLKDQLGPCLDGNPTVRETPQDVVLYGFGRIGRLLARLLSERAGNGEGMRLRAIVVRKPKVPDLEKRASLLRRDSVHGHFRGLITVDEEENAIVANGNHIKVIYANSPDEIDYTAYGIEDALICDNTGIWRDEEALGKHLKSKGASKVLLTAPGKGAVKNIVLGVNDDHLEGDEPIVSAASCTTNAIVPVLKAINDKWTIANGHVETVHAYTNDQNLIDNFHDKDRRGRSAALNMVITETGAAKAVAKAIPELAGKLTGSAIRVPTPNVSLAILTLNLEQDVTREDLNAHFAWAANHSDLHKQIDYTTSNEIVSSDLVGSRHAAVVDSQATIGEGKRCVVYVWYDNEFGYSVQVVRLLQKMAGITYPSFPC